MIILDTNIISELMKPHPSSQVIRWIDTQEPSQLFITTITIAEISYGISALPKGLRQQTLQKAFDKAIQSTFQYRVLSFNEKAAYQYGKIMGDRKRLGKPLSILDGQIAAISLTEEAVLATRNTQDFQHCGLEIINPFNE